MVDLRGTSEDAGGERMRGAAIAAAVLLTGVLGVLDWWTGYEVSVLALYLAPPVLAGWYAGRGWAVALAAACAAAWLGADLLAGHAYSHPAIPVWNAVARLGIFAAVGLLTAEVRTARTRAARGVDEDGMMDGGSFYRVVEREYARLQRHGRPLTLAYVDPEGVRADAGSAGETFSAAVLDTLRATLRATDVVARPRGLEFAVLLADTSPEAAGIAMGRLRGALEAVAAEHGRCVSLGAVCCAAPVAEVNQVVQRAFQLMYEAERTPGCVGLSLESLTADATPAPIAGRPSGAVRAG